MSKIYEKIMNLAVEHTGWYYAVCYAIGMVLCVGLTILLKKLGFYRWLYS